MIDIKQYLEQTNTVLLAKDAFEYLKERASVPDKVIAEYDPSADLISREEALTAFADYVGSGMSMNDFDALWDIVAKMPAVNPTKTGHWSHDGSHWKNRFICSGCGYKLFDEPTNYCPNCGAKMQESEDKE